MYVTDQIFYHIHKINEYSSQWTPGKQIDFTKKQLNKFNAFYSQSVRQFFLNGEGLLPIQAVQFILSNAKSLPEEIILDFIKFTNDVFGDYAIYLRERVFEDVRQLYFSNLPSRRTGIWVFPLSAKEYWCSILTGEKRILKLNLTGVMHRADQRHLNAEIIPENILRQRAFEYWTGSDGTNPAEEEYLFEGIVKVLEDCT